MALKGISMIVALITMVVSQVVSAGYKPLKVYILAGPSYMQGQAQVSTIPRMALSPVTKAMHDQILDENGQPKVHKNVSMVYFTGGDEKKGAQIAIYNCIAPQFWVRAPIGNACWVIGNRKLGEPEFRLATPRSLYLAQLNARLGKKAYVKATIEVQRKGTIYELLEKRLDQQKENPQ